MYVNFTDTNCWHGVGALSLEVASFDNAIEPRGFMAELLPTKQPALRLHECLALCDHTPGCNAVTVSVQGRCHRRAGVLMPDPEAGGCAHHPAHQKGVYTYVRASVEPSPLPSEREDEQPGRCAAALRHPAAQSSEGFRLHTPQLALFEQQQAVSASDDRMRLLYAWWRAQSIDLVARRSPLTQSRSTCARISPQPPLAPLRLRRCSRSCATCRARVLETRTTSTITASFRPWTPTAAGRCHHCHSANTMAADALF